MINWIANLLGKNKTQDNADAEQDDKPIERRYYKVKAKSYYGLCGTKVIHGEVELLHVPDGFCIDNDSNYDCFKLSRRQSSSLYAIIPKGAEFVSEQEYLEGVSK